MKKIYLLIAAVFYLHINLSAQIQTQTRTCNVINAGIPENWVNLDPINASLSLDNKFVYSKTIKSNKTSHIPSTGLIGFLNFGFNLPTNAIIDRIDVKVRRHKIGKSNFEDSWVSLDARCGNFWCSYGAQMVNQNKFNWSNNATDVIFIQPGEGTFTRGGVIQPYLWTPAIINDPMFGVSFAANLTGSSSGPGAAVYIDYLEIKVYYTETVSSSKLAKASTLENSTHNKISIDPNPVTSESILTFEELKDNATVIITDLTGKVISNSALKEGINNYPVDLTNQPSGLYLVKMVHKNGEVLIQKLIKQ